MRRREAVERVEASTPARRPATEQRYQEILAAALACFSERGYTATTLSEIRARSGASVGSIYHLFESKEDIAGALYLEGLRDYQQGLTAQIARGVSAERAVRGAVEHYLSWVAHNAALARFVMNTRQTELVPRVRDELREMNRAFFRTLREHFDPHVQAGRVKDLPWDVFVAIVMGPAHEHARQHLKGRGRVALRDAAKMLSKAAWDGVRAR